MRSTDAAADPSRDRRGLAAGVGQDHRRPGRTRPRRRPGRGTGAGRPGRGAGAVAGAQGIPPNPGAWLMLTAKHRAIDRLRRNERLERKLRPARPRAGSARSSGVFAAEFDAGWTRTTIEDDLLRLMFIACHPVLSTEARVALTLRLLGGLTTEEIARGVPRPGADDRPADRARQADAGQQAGPVRGAAGRRAARPAGLGARSPLPDLQRGLLGDGRGRLDASGAVRRGAPPRPHAGRAHARPSRRCTAWSR